MTIQSLLGKIRILVVVFSSINELAFAKEKNTWIWDVAECHDFFFVEKKLPHYPTTIIFLVYSLNKAIKHNVLYNYITCTFCYILL